LSSVSSRESVIIEKAAINPPQGKWVSALQFAVKRGHLRIVRVLLQHGVDCNQKDGEGLTPLIHSIISNHEDVMSSLVQSGARIYETDDHQRNPNHWAVSQRREALLEVLLKRRSGDQTLIESHDLSENATPHSRGYRL
jgi:ankyrin repeat protein